MNNRYEKPTNDYELEVIRMEHKERIEEEYTSRKLAKYHVLFWLGFWVVVLSSCTIPAIVYNVG